jgi:hypothetical protein
MLLSFKPSMRASHRADLWGLCSTASLTCSALLGVCSQRGRPWGLLSFTDPSWCYFDTHNSRVLHHVWNCSWKPCYIAVIVSVLIISSTAAMGCCTDQHYIPTKLQRALYMTNVSTEVPHSRKDDNTFQTPLGISGTPYIWKYTVQRSLWKVSILHMPRYIYFTNTCLKM